MHKQLFIQYLWIFIKKDMGRMPAVSLDIQMELEVLPVLILFHLT